MLDLNFCTLLFSATNGNQIVIDPNGDTILTLRSPYSEGEETDFVLHFQVSSQVLSAESFYFVARFKSSWAPAVQSDGKYHLSCEEHDAVGLNILLVTIHQPFSARQRAGGPVGLPSTVSLETLTGIVRTTDYFQMRPASDTLGTWSMRWFYQFQRHNGTWLLPNRYGEEIMMWWCLARDFEIRSLQLAAESIIFQHTGRIEGFDCPIRRPELDGLEEERQWRGFGQEVFESIL
ncbi:hypothetical protein N0V86_005983 [Didymella sp. IMI 355093]|nr:hypothetical protein N0V86_005983 [Didymella sp. IMI 355093]